MNVEFPPKSDTLRRSHHRSFRVTLTLTSRCSQDSTAKIVYKRYNNSRHGNHTEIPITRTLVFAGDVASSVVIHASSKSARVVFNTYHVSTNRWLKLTERSSQATTSVVNVPNRTPRFALRKLPFKKLGALVVHKWTP